MIVKNEERVIARCLESVKPFISYWVIADTGSTDKTKEVIQQTMAGIPGEIIDVEWQGWAVTRTAPLTVCRPHVDYVLAVIDADETLEAPPSAFDSLTLAAYDIWRQKGELEWPRTSVLKADLPWMFEAVGDRHEMPVLGAGFVPGRGQIEGAWMRNHSDGMSQGDPAVEIERYRKDAEALKEALAKNPTDGRTAFYLAQSYRDSVQTTKAVDAYLVRANMQTGFHEERYIAFLEAAKLMVFPLGWPREKWEPVFLRAHELRPQRAEALFHLGRTLRMQMHFAAAEIYLRQAVALPRPTGELLFIQGSIYRWWAKDELATTLCRLGKWQEAAAMLRELLQIHPPEESRYRSMLADCERGLGILPAAPPAAVVPAAPAVELEILQAGRYRLIWPKVKWIECFEEHRAALAEVLPEIPGTGDIWFGVCRPECPEPPEDAIIYQLEAKGSEWFSGPNGERYKRLLARAREVWDYSKVNYTEYEAKVRRHVPLLWTKSLENLPIVDKDIDVGFYGSLNERRIEALGGPASIGQRVQVLFNKFGEERNRWLARQKVTIVPHFFENHPVEQARIGHMMANGIAVVAEESVDQADYPGPIYVPRDRILSTAEDLVAHTDWDKIGALQKSEFRSRPLLNHMLFEPRSGDEERVRDGVERLRLGAYQEAFDLLSPAPTSELSEYHERMRNSGLASCKRELARKQTIEAMGLEPTKPLKLNLGSGTRLLAGYKNIDKIPPADEVVDLSNPWPWPDESVDEIVADHVFQYLPDQVLTMNEAFRVLKKGGKLKIRIPLAPHESAFADPMIASFWAAGSSGGTFAFFIVGTPQHERHAKAYGITARFQPEAGRAWPADVAAPTGDCVLMLTKP